MTIRQFFFSRRGDSPFKRILIHAVLICMCIITVYPVLRIASVSIRPSNRLLSTDMAIIPEDATLNNYVSMLVERDFLQWLSNSLLLTISTSLIGVSIAASSAYAISRWYFPGRKLMIITLLATQMIPGAMLLLPLYIIATRAGLINTWHGTIFAYSVTAVPFSIWILKGYYDTIPRELEQAGLVDGLNRFQVFYRVILPLSAPALAIALLFNFTQIWNDFLLARIFLQSPSMITWPLGLARLQEQFQTQWGLFAAGAMMVSVPVMALFLFSARWLITGLTLGSVKG